MHCTHCGFANGEDDHRCLRCGRRLAGIVISAPAGYSGANALAMAPVFEPSETQDFVPPTATQRPAPMSLFEGSDQKVIPFDQIQRHVAGRNAAAPVSHPVAPLPVSPQPVSSSGAAAAPALQRPAVRKSAAPAAEQTLLDFLPAAAQQRTLKTDVPAQIYCEQPVATPQHRTLAAGVDAAMIFLAFGAFAGIVELSGASFGQGKIFWMMLGVSFVLISLFYGLIWAISGRETPGMDSTDLQLITFDGFPLDARSRTIRFASSWLSFCSGGLGLLWAMADEENLTWHDHISKTFPTFREVPRNFVRQRR